MKVVNVMVTIPEEIANALGDDSQSAFPQVPFEVPNSVAALVLLTWFSTWRKSPAWRKAIGRTPINQVAKKPEQA